MVFHQRLKELRKSKNLTQKQMAEKLNIAELSYQRYEYGQRQPKVELLILISETFNISIDYILGITNNKNINR